MRDIYEFAYASRSKLATRRQRVTLSDNGPGHDTVHAMERYEQDGGFVGIGRSIVPRDAFNNLIP